jgi:hypothetical protein
VTTTQIAKHISIDALSVRMSLDNNVTHDNLSKWIISNGGTIHKSLALCTPDTVEDSSSSVSTNASKDYSHRGIFAKHSTIKKGDVLIRLPESLVLDGKDLPVQFGEKNASPWLRCIASLLQAWHIQGVTFKDKCNSDGKSYYLESLPETYDSLLNWKSWEIRHLLKGTTLGTIALSGISMDKDDNKAYNEQKEDSALEEHMYARFQSTVLPYLQHLKQQKGFFAEDVRIANTNTNNASNSNSSAKRPRIEITQDHLYNFFSQGCKCISTRAFHMQSLSSDGSSSYQGPYLLPYIDLLNHAPHTSPKHVTTLQRDPNDGSFVMVAERDIERSEEICHSYYSGAVDSDSNAKATSLNSAQLLQTFGFVDVNGAVERLQCMGKSSQASNIQMDNVTPAILTKQDICQACKAVSESSYPSSLGKSMEENGLLKEGWEHWELPLMGDDRTELSLRRKALDVLNDQVIITTESVLPEEIITICSLNFLPDEAIAELCDDNSQDSLQLTEDVLEDYFLGKLVLTSIIKTVDKKLKQYQVCLVDKELGGNIDRSSFLDLMKRIYYKDDGNTLIWGQSEFVDLNVLAKLTDSGDRHLDLMNKFICGMVVSLEERACLTQLKKTALSKLLQLDEN